MPLTKSLKVSKNPGLMQYFSVDEDPEAIFTDQREIGHGSFGAVYYVSEQSFVVPNWMLLLNVCTQNSWFSPGGGEMDD